MSFSPDGKRIVSGSYDGRLQISDAENGAEVSELVRVPLGGQSGSEVGSYLRLIDFSYHSTLGLRDFYRTCIESSKAGKEEGVDRWGSDVRCFHVPLCWRWSEERGGLADLHAEGSLGLRAVGRFFSRREMHRLRVQQPRADLGRRDRRGEQL